MFFRDKKDVADLEGFRIRVETLEFDLKQSRSENERLQSECENLRRDLDLARSGEARLTTENSTFAP